MISKTFFQDFEGRQVWLYEIANGDVKVGILNYGAIVHDIAVRTNNGFKQVALWHNNLQEYVAYGMYCGATVGRVANRISGGSYELQGKLYSLSVNDRAGNTLHGGKQGFDKQFYDVQIINDNTLQLSLISADGDQGFGGNIKFDVVYNVDNNALHITYNALSDADTYFAPTNHTYFNLTGNFGSVDNTVLTIFADQYTPVDDKQIPTGELRAVDNTVFDFRQGIPISYYFDSCNTQSLPIVRYDHNFVLKGNHACNVYCPQSGIVLDVYTDMPGMQLYTCRFGRKDAVTETSTGRFNAFCTECQYFPNAVNCSAFAKPLIKQNKPISHYIKFQFGIHKPN